VPVVNSTCSCACVGVPRTSARRCAGRSCSSGAAFSTDFRSAASRSVLSFAQKAIDVAFNTVSYLYLDRGVRVMH